MIMSLTTTITTITPAQDCSTESLKTVEKLILKNPYDSQLKNRAVCLARAVVLPTTGIIYCISINIFNFFRSTFLLIGSGLGCMLTLGQNSFLKKATKSCFQNFSKESINILKTPLQIAHLLGLTLLNIGGAVIHPSIAVINDKTSHRSISIEAVRKEIKEICGDEDLSPPLEESQTSKGIELT
jgi:hypothetical protein